MKILIFAIIQIFALAPAFAQTGRTWLAATLKAADTVWLIRHDDPPRARKDPARDQSGRKGKKRDLKDTKTLFKEKTREQS